MYILSTHGYKDFAFWSHLKIYI